MATQMVSVYTCRKCGGAMKPGKAIPNAYAVSDESTVNEVAHIGSAPLVDCMKCEACGWSVTAGVDVAERARLTRNHDGDLLLVDGECTTLVARCYTALWWAIVGHGSPDGPMMRRGSRGDGSEWMGTMRECLEDARQAAHVEARAADEARAEAKRLRDALSIYQHAVESGMVESDLRKAYENAAGLLDGVRPVEAPSSYMARVYDLLGIAKDCRTPDVLMERVLDLHRRATNGVKGGS